MFKTTNSDFRPSDPTLEIPLNNDTIEMKQKDMAELLEIQECREFAHHYGISFYYKEGRRRETSHRVEFRQSTQTVSAVGSNLAEVAEEAMNEAIIKFNLPRNFTPSYTRVAG